MNSSTQAPVFDTEKLYADAVAAKAKAEAAAAASDDRGSANLDSTFIRLGKGVRAAPIVDALRRAGLSADVTRWIGRGVMVAPPADGQANKRMAANDALHDSLRDAGWRVLCFSHMD